jgi:hypothetical protein
VHKSKVYEFTCDVAGNFVKIVSGTDDKKLAIGNVEVFPSKGKKEIEKAKTDGDDNYVNDSDASSVDLSDDSSEFEDFAHPNAD